MTAPKLLVQLRRALRARHMSPRTEQAYVAWCRRFVRFCGMLHPAGCGVAEVRALLEALATQSRVAASTQNQACAAIQFLYTQVLGRSLGALPSYVHALRPKRLPNVLEPEEVSEVLAVLDGTPRLVAMLL